VKFEIHLLKGVNMSMKTILVIVSYVLAIFPVGWIIGLFLNRFKDQVELGKGLQNAGKYIGWLERFLIVTFVWAGELSAIGFLIAAKSIFRFGEIKDKQDRQLAEYILIGTLLSLRIIFKLKKMKLIIYLKDLMYQQLVLLVN